MAAAMSTRPPRSESRVRTRFVGVRFTPDEHAALSAAADSLGCTVPALVRLAVTLHADPHVRTDPTRRFGRPTVRGISVDAVAGMVWAGEDVETMADEYHLTRPDVLVACWWQSTYGPYRYRHAWRGWLRASEAEIARDEWDKVPDPPGSEDTDEGTDHG